MNPKNFEEYLEQFSHKLLSTTHPSKMEPPKKEFIKLIEEKLSENISYILFSNLMDILINTKQEISDKTLRELFENAALPSNLNRIHSLCMYLIVFNKKGYCNILERILEKYDKVPSLSEYVIEAIGKLGCLKCYNKIKEIAEYENIDNPKITFFAKEALKELKND